MVLSKMQSKREHYHVTTLGKIAFEVHTHACARNCAISHTNVGVAEFKGGGNNVPLHRRLSCMCGVIRRPAGYGRCRAA